MKSTTTAPANRDHIEDLTDQLVAMRNPQSHEQEITELDEQVSMDENLYYWAELIWDCDNPPPHTASALSAAHLTDMLEYARDNPHDAMWRPTAQTVMVAAQRIIDERVDAEEEAAKAAALDAMLDDDSHTE